MESEARTTARPPLSVLMCEVLALAAPTTLLAAVQSASLLFETPPLDPVTYAAVALLLLVVAVVASLVPARRAMRVDPLLALRADG